MGEPFLFGGMLSFFIFITILVVMSFSETVHDKESKFPTVVAHACLLLFILLSDVIMAVNLLRVMLEAWGVIVGG